MSIGLTFRCRQLHFQTLSQLQNDLPPQVLRQQPVYLWDAKDKVMPIHLDCLTSMEVSVISISDR